MTLYDLRKNALTGKAIFYVADPSFGKVKLTKEEFASHWCGADGEGIALLMSPTEDFMRRTPIKKKLDFTANIRMYLKRFRHEYSILLWGMLFSSLFAMMLPFLTQSLIDMGIKSKDIGIVVMLLLAQLFLFTGSTIISVIRDWTLLYCNFYINIDIISSFLKKTIRLPFKFFETKQLGDFTTRINDHGKIQNFLTSSSVTVIFSFFNFIVYFCILISYDIRIMLVYAGLTILSLLWSAFFIKRERSLEYGRYSIQSKTHQYVYEIINGISEIKLNRTEEYQLECWRSSQMKLLEIDIKIQQLTQFDRIGFEALNKLKDILVIFMAACDVMYGEMTLGTLLAISYIIGIMSAPISQIIDFIRNFQFALLSYERMNEVQLLADEDALASKRIGENTASRYGKISIKHLSFQYEGPRSPKVLDDITLDIPIGKTTAIVGESGSGKTTLMKILLKYYDDYKGDIQIDGTNLRDITASSLREQCGVVMQTGYIFSDTLERNIATGDKPIDGTMLERSIYIAHLGDFVKLLPQKLKTKLGTGGNGISGGQKQRILIARAVYKNPAFILLDEATSSLDATTERHIYERLKGFLDGKTVVTIAHRLSTVVNADQIVVLKDGRIMECGNHVELLANNSYYYNLVKDQLQIGN